MSIKKIYFIRHGELNLPFKNYSDMPFSTLVDLGTGMLNPGVNIDTTSANILNFLKNVNKKIDIIYTSPRTRCRQTSKLIQNSISKRLNICPPILTSELISEIIFNLDRIYKNKEINIQDINIAVFNAIISGNGADSFNFNYTKINNFFKILDKEKNIIVVTHDFIMRIIEMFINNNGENKNKPTLKDFMETKRNAYVEGFSVNHDLTGKQIY